MENQTENNKLIAEFMGLELTHERFNGYYYTDNTPQVLCDIIDDEIESELDFVFLDFASSWDWLMPVVEKIEDLQFKGVGDSILYYDVMILPDAIIIQRNDNEKSLIVVNKSDTVGELYKHDIILFEDKKTALYQAVILFIEWYNLNK